MKHRLPNTFTLRAIILALVASALLVLPTTGLAQTQPADRAQSFEQTSEDETQIQAELNTLTFVTSPPRIELKGAPGTTLQAQVKVKNVTEETRQYEMNVYDFIVAEDGFTPIVVSEQTSGRWSSASWTIVSPNQFTVTPNSSQDVDVVIQIPQDALPGGHYAMVTQNPLRETEQTLINESGDEIESSAVIIPRVGTLLYITVEGDIHEEALVRNFQAPYFSEFGPIPFSYIVENQSDIHIRPQSTITVRNIFGQVKEVVTVEPKNIFPLANREFAAEWDTYWGFGPYSATLDVSYGETGMTYRTALRFWIIPYRVILAILVVLGAGMAIGISIKRHLHHRGDLKTKQIEILEEKVKSLENELQNH